MMALADQLAALATLSTAQLRCEWERVFGEAAPPAFRMDLLARGIAYELQVKAHGGLSAGVARQLADATRKSGEPNAAHTLRVGTRLAREWHGRTHHVLVDEDGFRYRERQYASLTAIAREITGTAWSGPRFFGLTSRAASAKQSHAT